MSRWDKSSQQVVPYQWLLRAVGAYLDGAGAARAHLMEGPNGFIVWHQNNFVLSDPVMRQFSYDELLETKSRMEGGRAGDQVTDIKGHYQDFLRALGHELEQVPAYELLIDELEDSFLLTYQFLLPNEGYQPHKRLTVIGPDERQDMLNRAYDRRKPPPEKRSKLSILGRR